MQIGLFYTLYVQYILSSFWLESCFFFCGVPFQININKSIKRYNNNSIIKLKTHLVTVALGFTIITIMYHLLYMY